MSQALATLLVQRLVVDPASIDGALVSQDGFLVEFDVGVMNCNGRVVDVNWIVRVPPNHDLLVHQWDASSAHLQVELAALQNTWWRSLQLLVMHLGLVSFRHINLSTVSGVYML